ncbi:MAG: hypothetical protein ABR568_05185 [Pyrinomonadaceae bacterium]
MPWDGDDLAGKMEENLERQQAAAEDRSRTSTGSAADRARNSQLESLRLSRSRIMVQLARATVPAHRTMLERALKAIDDQMTKKQ